MFLVGDIGGTHTRLSCIDEDTFEVAEIADFYNEKERAFVEMVQKFCEKKPCTGATFGVAGRVENQICQMTNIPWTLDGRELSRELQMPVFLLNDMEAYAYGIENVKPSDYVVIQEGTKKKGNSVVLAPGTGLGESALVYDGQKRFPFASEGGHADVAFITKDEMEIFSFFQKKYGHVSYERIISGRGLLDLCQFFSEKKNKPIFVNPRNIVDNPEATDVIENFLSFYGRKAGNSALEFLSVGGVFLGGRITMDLIEKWKKQPKWTEIFLESFNNKGRFSSFMKTIPIYALTSDHIPLKGAALYLKGKK
jgi:glucokinase